MKKMRKMKLKNRDCKLCGATFTTFSHNKLLCDDCQKERHRQRMREYARKKKASPELFVKPKRPRKPHPNDNILELVCQADKLGMSYGYYIAKLYDEERRKK